MGVVGYSVLDIVDSPIIRKARPILSAGSDDAVYIPPDQLETLADGTPARALVKPSPPASFRERILGKVSGWFPWVAKLIRKSEISLSDQEKKYIESVAESPVAIDFLRIFNILSKTRGEFLRLLYERFKSVMEVEAQKVEERNEVEGAREAHLFLEEDEMEPDRKRELLLENFQRVLSHLNTLTPEQAVCIREILSIVSAQRDNHDLIQSISLDFLDLVNKKRQFRKLRRGRRFEELTAVSGTIDDEED